MSLDLLELELEKSTCVSTVEAQVGFNPTSRPDSRDVATQDTQDTQQSTACPAEDSSLAVPIPQEGPTCGEPETRSKRAGRYPDGPFKSTSPPSEFRIDQPLWNDPKPQAQRKFEKTEYRIMAVLKAQGFTNNEIADATGYTYSTVSIILRQPHVRELTLQEVKRAGREGVQTLLCGIAPRAVLKLEEVMESDKAPPDVQRKAAKDVIELAYGKAKQQVEFGEASTLDNKSQAELLAIINKGLTEQACVN